MLRHLDRTLSARFVLSLVHPLQCHYYYGGFMISKFLFFAILPTLTWANSNEICTFSQTAKEAQFFIDYKVNTGNQAFGTCLNQAIHEKFLQKISYGQKIQINLLTIEQTVLEILADEKQAREAAQLKGEIFESGLDANGNSNFGSELDAETDLKRLNPLLDENGDIKE